MVEWYWEVFEINFEGSQHTSNQYVLGKKNHMDFTKESVISNSMIAKYSITELYTIQAISVTFIVTICAEFYATLS